MKSRVSLYAVAENCIDKIGQQHPEVKFSLAFSQSPTNPEDYDMSGDEVLLQTAIENMLSNAVKYGDGTPVAVLLTTDKEQVSIEVMNGGPLIATDEVDHLFSVPPIKDGNPAVVSDLFYCRRSFIAMAVLSIIGLRMAKMPFSFNFPGVTTHRFVIY
jgi:hypothetical protein